MLGNAINLHTTSENSNTTNNPLFVYPVSLPYALQKRVCIVHHGTRMATVKEQIRFFMVGTPPILYLGEFYKYQLERTEFIRPL